MAAKKTLIRQRMRVNKNQVERMGEPVNATGSADPVGANASKNGPDTQRGKIGNVQLKIKVEVAKKMKKKKQSLKKNCL